MNDADYEGSDGDGGGDDFRLLSWSRPYLRFQPANLLGMIMERLLLLEGAIGAHALCCCCGCDHRMLLDLEMLQLWLLLLPSLLLLLLLLLLMLLLIVSCRELDLMVLLVMLEVCLLIMRSGCGG